MDELQKPIVVRVTGIETANHADAERIVRKAIARKCGHTTDEARALAFKIKVVPSCDDPKTSDVLLEFDVRQPFPPFLSKLQEQPLASVSIACDENDEDYLTFDHHFHGFTQLYSVLTDCTITAEYVLMELLHPPS
jgi:hypothetical protein